MHSDILELSLGSDKLQSVDDILKFEILIYYLNDFNRIIYYLNNLLFK